MYVCVGEGGGHVCVCGECSTSFMTKMFTFNWECILRKIVCDLKFYGYLLITRCIHMSVCAGGWGVRVVFNFSDHLSKVVYLSNFELVAFFACNILFKLANSANVSFCDSNK